MTDLVERDAPLDVAALDRGLRTEWERLCGESDVPLARTVALNVIGVARDRDREMLAAAIQGLLERHPCRAFLVLLGDDSLRAELHTLTRLEAKTRQLRLEQISLHAGEGDAAKIPNLIRPLMISDLGSMLFWAGKLPSDLSLLEKLGGMTDQLAFDSSMFEEPESDLERLATLPYARADLTWIRLTAWRRALAEAFEHFEWNRALATELTIHLGPACGARAAACQLGRWLERELDASIAHADIESPSTSQPMRVELRHGDVHVDVVHHPAVNQLRVHLTLKDHCLLPFEVVTTDLTRGRLLAIAADGI